MIGWEGLDWIHVAEYTDIWRVPLNTVYPTTPHNTQDMLHQDEIFLNDRRRCLCAYSLQFWTTATPEMTYS
jgi:hypothetical protein